MKGNRAVLTAIVVLLVVLVGWWLFRSGGRAEAVDLVARFDTAQKRPDPALFSVEDATLNGQTLRSIAVKPAVGTRMIHKVAVPDDGWLRLSVGLKPEAWTQEGNGVKFQVVVSDGRQSEELFSQHVNPYANEGDRKWIEVTVDLSTYAGEEVEVVFNTYSSLPGQPDDQRGDLALWGGPQIVVR
jgi:hypothetical protein